MVNTDGIPGTLGILPCMRLQLNFGRKPENQEETCTDMGKTFWSFKQATLSVAPVCTQKLHYSNTQIECSDLSVKNKITSSQVERAEPRFLCRVNGLTLPNQALWLVAGQVCPTGWRTCAHAGEIIPHSWGGNI